VIVSNSHMLHHICDKITVVFRVSSTFYLSSCVNIDSVLSVRSLLIQSESGNFAIHKHCDFGGYVTLVKFDPHKYCCSQLAYISFRYAHRT